MSTGRAVAIYIEALREMMLASEESMYTALLILRSMTNDIDNDTDEEIRRISLDVVRAFQSDISLLQSLPCCPYCQWVIYPDEPHRYCIEALKAQAKRNWQQYRLNQQLAVRRAYEARSFAYLHDYEDDPEDALRQFVG